MSEKIEIIGAETHNLKNINLSIPKNKLVVITGVSGSGKSSLAFDTLYAEGQKKYLESLSTYARMIISTVSDATKVREIRGLSPTIAINQKTVSNSPRSTVGTITEIYDFYRLLFANIGTPYCINHPEQPLKKDTIQGIFDKVINFSDENERIMVIFPFASIHKDANILSLFSVAQSVADDGFVRFLVGNNVFSVGDNLSKDVEVATDEVFIIVDRLSIKKKDENFLLRLKDSLILSGEKSGGNIGIFFVSSGKIKKYSLNNSCPVCSYSIDKLTISNFSFNSHYGACDDCGGLGYKTSFEESGIIDESLSLSDGAILPWSSPYYLSLLENVSVVYNIPMNTPFGKLNKKQKDIILYGVSEKEVEMGKYKVRFEGVLPNLERRYFDSENKSDYHVRHLSKFVTEKECRSCRGFRLKNPFLKVKIQGLNIGEISALSVDESLKFFENLQLSVSEKIIAEGILKNIVDRLGFLKGVGLGYVTLARRANTLSGGESQRIRLATQIGTKLEGIIYVLDEPSIGLHPRDNDMLIDNLKRLAKLGNTVIVVEHDEDIMRQSDYIVDIGPRAGVYGGNVLFSGTYNELISSKDTETANYLSGKKIINRHNRQSSTAKKFLSIYGASENNLKNINVRFPIGKMTVVAGVSGSGKSSLVMDVLANSLLNHFNKSSIPTGKHVKIEGMEHLDKAIIIDQSPIGRTPHSNIATYTGVFTFIREVFASSLDAKSRGFNVGRFSFNTKGGRCEVCEGSGTKKVEMHFLPDVYVECEGCKGTRYNNETLSVKFKGKTIADVLNMTILEVSEFFISFPRIKRILDVLIDVGLEYITLGQSAPTLSGGESQRIKLAFDLSKRSTGKTVYILDEPTTGLHFSDVQKLLDILSALVEKGNTVIVIEHNLDIIANADAIVDIGPEGGNAGGNLVFAGPTEKILSVAESYTGKALRRYLEYRNK